MTVVKVDATLADFDDLFAAHFTKDNDDKAVKVKLLLFLADRNAPGSDLTWCPDCNVAEPVIYSKLEDAVQEGRDVLLLRAFVGDKPTWRDPAHPWRADPRFRLKGVPTLLRWDSSKGAAVGRLEDDEANLPDKIHQILNLD